jgi:antitoxin HicB
MSEEFRIDEYPFMIRRLTEDEGSGFLIEFPDLPGCISDGETPEAAIASGRDAMLCYFRNCQEFGDPIPEPGSSVPLAVPTEVHERLSAVAEKRHVRPEQLGSDFIAQALDRQEPAA